MVKRSIRRWGMVGIMACGATVGDAQVVTHHHYFHSARPLAANVIVPQARSFVDTSAAAGSAAVRAAGHVSVTSVEVGVVIVEQSATTTMDIGLKNLTGARQEAEMLIPVPAGAVIRGFTFQGSAAEPTAELLPKETAKDAYRDIVAKIRDPALLEFVHCSLVRSAVFPLEPHGTQKVRLTYEHLLTADGGRVDYELPRSESLEYQVPWRIAVRIKSKRGIATVYSPSHRLTTRKDVDRVASVSVAEAEA